MTADLLQMADRIWAGEVSMAEWHPMSVSGGALEVVPGVAFVPGFSNAIAIDTGDSLVLVDSGGFLDPDHVHGLVRAWSEKPLHKAVFTHGHVDHVFGIGPFDAERRVEVLAHENVVHRFDRYRMTAGYNSVINQRQFQVPGLEWPTEYRYPDTTYRETLSFSEGDVTIELHHARGETDDHTWVWVPERKLLCCGDLFIWCSPNAGNPQKAQRYPREWAIALREMRELGAEVMLPGHGLPVMGAERVGEALVTTAAYLESIVEQSLELMNEGRPLEEIVRRVQPPANLAAKPWLQPIYDEPEFIVRNIWRLYGGWYTGDPAGLKPSPPGALAAAVAEMTGGAGRMAAEARARAAAGDLALACDLIELAHEAAPDDPEVAAARAEIYSQRAAAESSTMAQGVFSWAATRTPTQKNKGGP